MINNDKSRHDLEFRLLSGFMDSEITPDLWNSLLTNGSSDVIFMTWHWQKAWWQVFARGKLLITVAIRDGKPVAIASLFSDGGMIFFVGSGCADELDFIGDISDPNILEGMITLAINEVSEFLGCRLYHVPKLSPTHESLKQVSNILKFQIFDEGELPLPKLSIKNSPDKANEAIAKKTIQTIDIKDIFDRRRLSLCCC